MRKLMIICWVLLGLFFHACGERQVTPLAQKATVNPTQRSSEKQQKTTVKITDKNNLRSQIKVTGGNQAKINFYDVDGNLVSEFDIVENSPVSDIEYPVAFINKFGLPVYDAAEKETKLSKEFRRKLIAPEDLAKFKNDTITYIYPVSGYSYDNDKYFIFYYDVIAVSFGKKIGDKGTIYIFNNSGGIIQKFENLNIEVWNPSLTGDGKYLAFRYGTDFDGSYLVPDGFRIYDIKSKELIYAEHFQGLDSRDLPPYNNYSDRIAPLGKEAFFADIAKSSVVDGKELPNSRRIIINPEKRIYYYLDMLEDPIYKMQITEKRNLKFIKMTETEMIYQDVDSKDKVIIDYETYYHRKKL